MLPRLRGVPKITLHYDQETIFELNKITNKDYDHIFLEKIRALNQHLLRLRYANQVRADSNTRCPVLMRRLDVLHIPDILNNDVDLPVLDHTKECIDGRHERRLVTRDLVEDSPPVREHLSILKQQLRQRHERATGGLLARQRLLVLAVPDEQALLADAAAARRQGGVRLLPAAGAEGVEDDVRAAERLHGRDPVFVGVHEGRGAVRAQRLVVARRRRAVDRGAPHLA